MANINTSNITIEVDDHIGPNNTTHHQIRDQSLSSIV